MAYPAVRPAAIPPAVMAAGIAFSLNCARLLKSLISQSIFFAYARSSGSGFTAVAKPTVDSIGMSLAESE